MTSASFSNRDWVIATRIALAVLALVSIPYVLGYAFADPRTEYMGIVMNPEDSQSYFAKMREGYEGNWLYAIPFTSEDHSPAFVGGFYLALGHLARFLGLSLTAVWHLSRVVADLILFLTIFYFVTIFAGDPPTRWIAYLLSLFGSGLGWLLMVINQPYWLGEFPVDFKMPEAHIFFTALTFPHVAMGIVLMLLSFGFSLRAYDASMGTWLDGIGAGVANLALAIVYPFLIYPVFLTAVFYWLYRVITARRIMWQRVIVLGISFLMPAPLLFYYASTLSTNQVFRAWEAQSITPSPPLPHYLLAYGAMLLLGFLVPVSQRARFAFLWCWIIAVALLVYAPLNAQRRFVEGVHVPLAILASVGFSQTVLPWVGRTRLFHWLAARPRYSVQGLERLLLVAFLLMMSLSNLYILVSTSITASVQPIYPLFRLRAEVEAVDWLRANTARSSVVLGEAETGNFIAARAGNRVVVGHWAETVDWQKKFEETNRFYRAELDDAAQRELFARYRVAYVFFGPRERELGMVNFPRVDYAQTVFSNVAVQIFAIRVK